mgnify:CR=1 FL=1
MAKASGKSSKVKVLAHHSAVLKYTADGAKTMKALAKALRDEADVWDALAKQGAKLIEPVADGWVHYRVPGHYVDLDEDTGEEDSCLQCVTD